MYGWTYGQRSMLIAPAIGWGLIKIVDVLIEVDPH